MERTAPKPRRGGLASRRTLTFVALGAILAVGGTAAWRYRWHLVGAGGELGDALGPKIERVQMELALRDPWESSTERTSKRGFQFGSVATDGWEDFKPKDAAWTRCPTVVAGEFGKGLIAASGAPPSEGCPHQMIFQMAVQTPLMTVQAPQGSDVYAWLTRNEDTLKILESELGQGVFSGFVDMLRIRAEDLRIAELSGSILKPVFESALSASARLDLVPAHGASGTTLSFVKKEGVLAHRALLILTRSLTGVAYEVPQLAQPIVELRYGTRRLLIADDGERLYLATGLQGLVDVLEDAAVAIPPATSGSLVATLRAEALLDKLQDVLAGQSTWRFHFGLDLTQSKTAPANAVFEAARAFGAIDGKIPKEVLGAIPFDAFAGLATALRLPADLSHADWNALAQGRADNLRAGGLALIWELNAEVAGLTSVGLVLAPATGKDLDALSKIWSDPALVGSCKDTVLAATDAVLLTRMREACEGRSLSILKWRPGDGGVLALDGEQVAMFLNPAAGGRELYAAGGGIPGEGAWTEPTSDDKDAVAAKRKAMEELAKRTQDTLESLPVFGYAGARRDDGVMTLAGFTAHTGASTKRE